MDEQTRDRYPDLNARVIGEWVSEGWIWGVPVAREKFLAARDEGRWDVLLTPTVPMPRDWLGDVRGKRLLGLASGGAQQMPLFAALGAVCTVMDYTPAQLEAERAYAAREGYAIDIVRGDMSLPFPFADGAFDIVFNPVSTCYVADVAHVYAQCARVLRPGGVLATGCDNGFNFLFDEDDERHIVNRLPFDPLRNPEHMQKCLARNCAVEFSHTVADHLGGLLRAGFIIRDVYDDTNGSGFLHDMNLKTFLAIRAVRG